MPKRFEDDVRSFSPMARKAISDVRAGRGDYLKQGRKSAEAAQEARAAAGGVLPEYMFAQARKGKLNRKRGL